MIRTATAVLGIVVVGLSGIAIAADVEPGFVSLFDGKSLNGWSCPPGSYAVEDGAIVCVKGGKGNLLSDKEYSDFVMRFEFKLTPGANNGLGIRCPKLLTGNLHIDGIESQIIDHTDKVKYANLKPYQFHGSIYGIVPAKQVGLKPVGEWNEEEVTASGRRIKVVLNGETIVDADLDEASTPKTIDGASHPGLKRTKGHIGLLGHGDRIEVRNVRIKELSP